MALCRTAINLRLMSGRGLVVEVEAFAEWGNVKDVIEAQEGFPRCSQRLFCGSDELDDYQIVDAEVDVTLVVEVVKISHTVNSILSRLAQGEVSTTAAALADIEINSAEELKTAVQMLYHHGLRQPQICSKIFRTLHVRAQVFPPEHTGEKPQSFTRVLLDFLQGQWEHLHSTLTPGKSELTKFNTEELAAILLNRKACLLENVRLLGHLFNEGVMRRKVIVQILNEFIGGPLNVRNLPSPDAVEAACELLAITGTHVGARFHLRRLAHLMTFLVEDKGVYYVYPEWLRVLMRSVIRSSCKH